MNLGFAATMGDHEHALLRFAEQNLVRGHSALARRNLGHVDRHADISALGHLRRRRRETRGAHVLNRDDVPALDQLEARFEKKLFGERISDLNARPLRIACLREIFGCERRSVNAVSAGPRANRDDRIADAFRLGTNEIALVQEPDAHGVDERIALVCIVEDDLAGDGRNADAVAVVADAFDHDAAEQVTNARAVEGAEAKRVEHRDRTRAHRENVAKNSADSGRRSLIRLDRRRMIVRLDLERHREAVADRYHAGVFARTLQHVRRFGRQRVLRMGRECLYEQCSLHSALTIPSSVKVGVRPSIATSRSYSSAVRPCSATSSGVIGGSPGRGITSVIQAATVARID